MLHPTRTLAALVLAAALVLPSCSSHHASASSTNPNVKILQRGPQGKPSLVRVDGRNWPVCGAQDKPDCLNPEAAGLA